VNERTLRKTYDRLLAIRVSGEERADCLSPEAMQSLLDRTGSDDQRLEMLDHVMACPHCLAEFELLRSVRRASEASDTV
jgi:hypothetical protein